MKAAYDGGIFLRWSPENSTIAHTPTPFSVLTNSVERIHTSGVVVVARFIFSSRGSATSPSGPISTTYKVDLCMVPVDIAITLPHPWKIALF